MRSSTFGLALAAAADAAPSLASAYLHLALTTVSKPPTSSYSLPSNSPPSTRHQSRQSDNDSSFLSRVATSADVGRYVVNVTVGDSAQDVSLVLKWHEWDTWIPDVSLACNSPSPPSHVDNNSQDDCALSSFDPDQSRTYVETFDSADPSDPRSFAWSSVNGHLASGHWFEDTIRLGDAVVDNFNMGLATVTQQLRLGTLALGYPVGGLSPVSGIFVDQLVAYGAIASPAFSLWADDPMSRSANLLFGAVDSPRFDGQLQRIDMWRYYKIYLDSVRVVTGPENNTDTSEVAGDPLDLARNVRIDPGDVFSRMPESVALSLWDWVGATYDPDLDLARIHCDAANTDDTNLRLLVRLDSNSGPILDVPLSDLILPQDSIDPYPRWDPEWCAFAIRGTNMTSLYTIGRQLLSRTYLVFDQVNGELGLAPVIFGDVGHNAIPFSSYGDTIPVSEEACTSESSMCQYDTQGGRTTTSDSEPSRELSHPRSGSPLLIIVIVAVAVFVAINCIGFGLCLWRKGKCCCGRKKKAPNSAAVAQYVADSTAMPWAYGNAHQLPYGMATQQGTLAAGALPVAMAGAGGGYYQPVVGYIPVMGGGGGGEPVLHQNSADAMALSELAPLQVPDPAGVSDTAGTGGDTVAANTRGVTSSRPVSPVSVTAGPSSPSPSPEVVAGPSGTKNSKGDEVR